MTGNDKHDDMFNEIFGEGAPFTGPDDPRLAQLMPMLIAVAGGAGIPGRIAADGQVGFHQNSQIFLPLGMGYEEAFRILQRHQRDSETPTTWNRKFNYRPDDGAHATHVVLRRMFGMAIGETQEVGGFFGTQVIPSETRDIAIAFNKRIQVPWGTVSVPRLPSLELNLCDQHSHPEYGRVFDLHAVGPRKYKAEVEAIFEAIEEELRVNSIYRGKALTGSNDLEFFDIDGFDPKQVVFSDPVEQTLEAKLWAPLRYPEAIRRQGVSLKRAVLLCGPFGTGKTSAAMITGQIALRNGWTFLSAKTGDDIEDVLRTARLYQPALVLYEDIDREADNADKAGLAQLLDTFDGITSKGGDLMMVLTTNHTEDVPQGMLRPGRLDAVVKIAELDRGGTERLIKATVPAGKLNDTVDYDNVFTAMDGYLPAFAREAVSSAVLFAINRLKGGEDFVLTTEDLVAAAESLRDQFDAYNAADEGLRQPPLEEMFGKIVQAAINGGHIDLPGYGPARIVLDSADSDTANN